MLVVSRKTERAQTHAAKKTKTTILCYAKITRLYRRLSATTATTSDGDDEDDDDDDDDESTV